ncbi:MAG: hypothetical protein WAT09_10610 [Paracoccaceae bacterium]
MSDRLIGTFNAGSCSLSCGDFRLTGDLLDQLKLLEPLAPLHQPHDPDPIRQIQSHFPGILRIGCFDTAFPRTQTRVAQIYGCRTG